MPLPRHTPHNRLLSLCLLIAGCLPVMPAQADAVSTLRSLLGFSYEKVSPASEDPLTVHELRATPLPASGVDLTTQTDDLWLRIRNGFSMPDLNDSYVLQHQQWYQSRPEGLRRMVERSSRYMHHIVEELEKRGMPTELALLPMVESSFNPMAYSRAHASGLWQFIPATGKRYNLEQNWWKDERRDIVASTSAALDYLQTIYEMNGDWHLALASYNWGEGAVKRAMEKNQAKGLPTDYSSLTMPNETRHYVPKLQALKNIFNNPKLMAQLRLPELLNRQQIATVEAGKPIDVAKAAKLAEMPVEEFVALNPSHNRPVIKGDVSLVIPADKVDTFQSNLENNQQPLSTWQAYTLKPGEKLDKVAPRFGITLDDLKRVNGIHGSLKISAGSTLLVPSATGEDSLDRISEAPMVADLSSLSDNKPPSARPASPPGAKSARGTKGKTGKTVVGSGKAPAKAGAKPATKNAAKSPVGQVKSSKPPAPAKNTAAARPKHR